MSRKIKFRVWDKLEKRFDSNYHLTMDLNGRVYNLQNGAGGEDYEVQQFTGLLDRNGVEIYEGDILEEIWKDGSNWLFQVKFGPFKSDINMYSGNGFYLDPINKDSGLTINSRDDFYNLQIVGNIFQNPELLK